MGNARNRRLRKEAKHLRELLKSDVLLFLTAWDHRVGRWLWQMHVTARKLMGEVRVDGECTPGTLGSDRREEKASELAVSDICKRVDELIKACGEKVEELVGTRTRALLNAECAKLVAQIYEPRAYRMIAHGQYTLKGKRQVKNRVLGESERI